MNATELIRLLVEAVVKFGDRPVVIETERNVEDISRLGQDYYNRDQGTCITIVGTGVDQ